MLLGIQAIGILFALSMLYLTFLYGKRKEFRTAEGVLWTIAWLGFIYITLFPRSLNFLVKDVLNVSRTLDFFIIVGFMFLIGLTFYNYYLLRRNQNRLEDLVRKLAIGKEEK